METPAEIESEGRSSIEQRIGPYRVVRELGRGGMGTVYLCEDTAVGNRHVALKVVHDPRAGGTDLIERFRREIRNLGVLRHPNLVQVLYAGEHDGHPYFVMEYVRGRELNKWLDEVATLPESQRIAAIVRLMAKVARGVEHAHQNGTIHRDLKPQNILVREDGEPMVLDFGIAKHTEDTTLTATSATPGTPSHMAPEQFEPVKIVKEELVDIWALGTILYLALTRERPFKGQSLASVSYQIVHGSPANLRKLNPLVPPALEDLVLRCLEKDPRKRVQSAHILGQKLESALHDVIHSARRRRTRAIALVSLATIVLATLALRPWRYFDTRARFGHLRPVVEGVGTRVIGASDREIAVASFQPTIRVRFDQVTEGATVEAALKTEDGVEFERALLAPMPAGYHQTTVKVPADRQREGMRARIDVYANGERLETQSPLLVLDTTAPRIVATIVSRGVELPLDAAASRPEFEVGSELRVVVTDPSKPIEAEWDRSDLPKGDPSSRSMPLMAEGTWRGVLTVHDAAGNEVSRPFELVIVAAASRTESTPATRVVSTDAGLPEVWAKVSVSGSKSKPDGPVSLHAGPNKILVASSVDQPFKWKFRVRDASEVVVAECDLTATGIFAAVSRTTVSRTLDGTLVLPTPGSGRLLTGQLVLIDDQGGERVQTLASPTFIEGSPKPRVRLRTSNGDLVIELDRLASPAAVQAFLDHVRGGDYDGIAFHEVRKDYYVKAGVFDEASQPKRPRLDLPGEWTKPRPTAAKLTVAMTDQAEFMIQLKDNPSLKSLKDLIEIGKVTTEGESILAKIGSEPVDPKTYRPAAPLLITKAVVESE